MTIIENIALNLSNTPNDSRVEQDFKTHAAISKFRSSLVQTHSRSAGAHDELFTASVMQSS